MNTAASLIQDVELEGQFDDLVLSCPEKGPLIAEADYDAIVLSCRRERRYRRDLLALKFRIVSQGAAFGVVLSGYCNLDFQRGRGRHLPTRSKLAVWLRRIHAFAPEVSCKRIHLKTFGKFQYLVRVATSKGTSQDPLPIAEYYSQVIDLLDVIGRITSKGSGL